MNTPLRLENYFFPHISVTADPEYVGAETDEVTFPLVQSELQETDKPNNFQLAINIFVEPKNQEKPIPYIIHLVAIGMFSVADNWPDKEKLLKINGASILYAAAREFLITITSRGPWPCYTLPTYSFLLGYVDRKEVTNDSKKESIKKPKKVRTKKTSSVSKNG
ncbi:MAG: protein-export chaperone SecB [Proteobacteria bacterium]|nr:protein-export chaperone SecB [Pseudomonadota bacterium]MBU4298296.1 protein-export chaperone SecB [Pseudomonadota bacterium]MCG2747565.1 protein-export chaperone SecB [Desulfobulbaceae bacterium]